MTLFTLAAAGFTAATLTLGPAPAGSAPEPVPTFDFRDCPAPPANADPGTWRCEAFVSQGTLSIRDREIPLGELRMTFAEGRVNGQYAQIFGALRHSPAHVPGAFGTTIRLRYGGHSDFRTVGNRRGELDLFAELRHPLLPAECTLGSPAKPLRSVVYDDPAVPRKVISQDPPTYYFGVVDQALTLPATQHCGPLGTLVDRHLGLPSPTGNNVFKQTTYVQYKPL
ncbi:hypothetical protein [Amycolatopsis sp. NPDC059021]|uniref:hypothetical protein n=1 Tax=Amycolatopsis sp. NPDC059021 TaxID=3346704 RepID=UPI0036705EF8